MRIWFACDWRAAARSIRFSASTSRLRRARSKPLWDALASHSMPAESPLAWLARRKARDGRALIEPVQLQAGERLRADFTRAQMMPRVTANWTSSVAQDRRNGGVATFTEAAVAARQRVRRALESVGPEFTGLLLDVCCFLKRLEDVERERGWPRGRPRWCCSLVSTGWRATTAMAPRRAALTLRTCGPGWRRAPRSRWVSEVLRPPSPGRPVRRTGCARPWSGSRSSAAA